MLAPCTLLCPLQSFAEKLAKLQAVEGTPAEPAEFSLNFLWLDKNIAVAVDQVFGPVSRAWGFCGLGVGVQLRLTHEGGFTCEAGRCASASVAFVP